MPRRSPLPSSRENLTDLLGQVDCFIEHHAGMTSDLNAMIERGKLLDPSSRGADDFQFALLFDRIIERQTKGYPSPHSFAEYLEFPFALDDAEGPSRFDVFWRDVEGHGPEAVNETFYRLAMELRRALAAKIEEVAGSPGDHSSAQTTFDLVEAMKVDHPRAKTQIAFLEFMQNRTIAKFQDLAHHVHEDDDANPDAIRKNIERVNEFLEGKALPLRYKCGSENVVVIRDLK